MVRLLTLQTVSIEVGRRVRIHFGRMQGPIYLRGHKESGLIRQLDFVLHFLKTKLQATNKTKKMRRLHLKS